MLVVGGRKGCAGKSGIYIIENTVNGNVYVGQAKDLYLRYKSHLNLLRKNDARENRHLRLSFNKYGENSFTFKPLLFCEQDRQILTYYENFWFTCFTNLGVKCYNTRPAIDSNLGIKHDKESNKKKSDRGKKNWESEEYREKVLSGVADYWTEEKRAERAEWARNRPNPFDYSKIEKDWLIIFPDGNELVIRNLSRFCKEHGLDSASMTSVSKGRNKTHKGFKCVCLSNKN